MKSTLLLGAIMALTCSSAVALADETVPTETPAPDPTPAVAAPEPATTEAPISDPFPAPATTTTVTYVAPPPPVLASAKEEYHPAVDASASTGTSFHVGFGMDLGLPSGAALGLVFNPKLDWLRLQASLTYNYLTFGGRGSVQLDPFALIHDSHGGIPFGLFADVQGGFSPTSNIPGHNDLPKVGYDYVNLYGGMRLGRPNGFHWNFEAGPSYLHVNTSNFQSIVNKAGGSTGLVIGNPTVSGWVVPTFETGFSVVFP